MLTDLADVGDAWEPGHVPRDHTVPQMYLRRFAVQRKKTFHTTMISVDDLAIRRATNIGNVAAPNGFYTFHDVDGVERRDLESFFGRIENLADPVFRTILDHPHYEFTPDWPLDADQRLRLAWFMAAQMVRTTRQRRRLEVTQERETLDPPGALSNEDVSTDHARFIVKAIGAIAMGLSIRPWALVHSSACLVTSDCPVVLLDDHDADDQVLAGASSAVVFPLDPHRAIFMPSAAECADNPARLVDHRIKMDGVGTAFVQAVVDAAFRDVFAHPQHPLGPWARPEGRLPKPGEPRREGGWAFEYAPLHPDLTIEKGWKHHDVN